jgi:hypothetical protein
MAVTDQEHGGINPAQPTKPKRQRHQGILCSGGTTTVTLSHQPAAPRPIPTRAQPLDKLRYRGNYNYTVTDANNCAANTSANVITQPSSLGDHSRVNRSNTV